jgi:O-antigen ligase
MTQPRATVTGESDFGTAKPHAAVRKSEEVEQSLFWIFIAGLAWCPFLFGSNTPTAWGINAILFSGLAVAYEVALFVRAEAHPVGIRQLALPASLFMAVLLWAVIQNATWTPVALHHPIWGMASDALDRPIAGSISVNRDLTTLAILRLVTAASVFWLALQLCRSPLRANFLLRAVVVIVTAYAAYGLISFAVMPGRVLWLENRPMLSYLTSTFFNRNNFATYSGIGLVTTFALVVRLYQREIPATSTRRLRLAALIEATGRKGGAMLLSCGFVMMVALLATGSRGGVLATVVGLVVIWTLLAGQESKASKAPRESMIILFLFGGATFIAFGDLFLDRMVQSGFQGRMSSYEMTLRSILDAPLLGYGYGTFEDIFPMFRDRSMSALGIWDKAHNTYLEISQGLGVIFAAVLVASVGLLVRCCLRGARIRRQSVAPAVATGVAVTVGAHAFVDFSLQIQAVTLTFIALLGSGVAQSESARSVLSD